MLITNPLARTPEPTAAPGKGFDDLNADRRLDKSNRDDFTRAFDERLRLAKERAESAAKKPDEVTTGREKPEPETEKKPLVAGKKSVSEKKSAEQIFIQVSKNQPQNNAETLKKGLPAVHTDGAKTENGLLSGIGRKKAAESSGIQLEKKKPDDVKISAAAVQIVPTEQKAESRNGRDQKIKPLDTGSERTEKDSGSLVNAKAKTDANMTEKAGFDKPKMVVIDQRSESQTKPQKTAETSSVDPKKKANSKEAASKEFTRLVNDQKLEIPAEKARVIETPVQSPATLRQTLPTEIVKQSTFILKGADNGEIRMILKPDNLGQVKINVEMKDNRLVAKIVVDNQAVKEILDSQMGHLKDQFLEQGFADAQVDVFVGQDSSGKKHEFSKTADNKRIIGQWDAQVPVADTYYFSTDGQVNLMA